jgi:hypothetical protein
VGETKHIPVPSAPTRAMRAKRFMGHLPIGFELRCRRYSNSA